MATSTRTSDIAAGETSVPVDGVASEAVGGDQVSSRYYRSPRFIGTIASFCFQVMAYYFGLLMPLTVLQAINADIGECRRGKFRNASSPGELTSNRARLKLRMGATNLDNLLVTQLCAGWKIFRHIWCVQSQQDCILQDLI